MEDSLPTDIVTLVDDEGVEREFEVLDFIENAQGRFSNRRQRNEKGRYRLA